MATSGCDYSFTHPSPASIVAAGLTFVFRYLAHNGTKNLGATEATNLHNAGLTIGLVFEDNADPLTNNAGTDYNSGVTDATFALGEANALTVPADRPIYVAVDVGSAYAGNAALNTRYQNYFQGWVDTIGLGRVGFYGGSILWTYLFAQGVVSGYFWQASASSWSSYIVPYPGAIVLQLLSAPLPGTDGDTAYISDFGQWPAPAGPPPPPPSGGTNYASVSVGAATLTQAAVQNLITPQTGHDQVIYSNAQATPAVPTIPPGTSNNFFTLATGISQAAYPVGMFSYDNVTFNDYGFEIAVSGNTNPPGVVIQPVVDSSGNISFSAVNNTGVTVPLILYIALLASYAPSLLPSSKTSLTQKLSYSNINTSVINPSNYATYRRISSDNVALGNSVTVAHGQGRIPNILFWVNIGGSITMNPVGWQSTGSLGVLGIKMDSTNIYFHVDSGTYNDCYYRIYKDNT